MIINFPGGDGVNAQFGKFSVKTDQPPDASAPSPFDLFLASLGTCAGFYILKFCKQRNIKTDGVSIIQRIHSDNSGALAGKIEIEVLVPTTFPEKYLKAMVNAAELCTVKKQIERPPKFDIHAKYV